MSLQGVTLQAPGIELELLELEQIAAGYHVVATYQLRDKLIGHCSKTLRAALDRALWRRVNQLLEVQCTEVVA